MTLQHPFALLDIERELTQDQRDIQTATRDFVIDRVKPNIANWFETGDLPIRELAIELGKIGLLGMHLQGYECAGTDATSYGLACMELEAGDSGIRSLVSVQGSLAMFAIYCYGSEEQKQQWLPAMAAGRAIGCFGLSEADHGSNPAGMTTSAKKDGADWVINGSKMWITNGSVADVAVIWAKTDEGIRGFCVDTKTPGFTSTAVKHKLSLRASITSELVFTDMRVPASAILPLATSLRAPLMCLAEARYGIIFGAVGAARDSFESALDYASQRTQFDGPISRHQITQEKFARMATRLNTAMLLALHLGKLKDAHEIRPEQISMGKFNNVEAAIGIARECRSILGAAGITTEYPIFRHMNNLESVLTYEGTHEIHALVIGEALTGISAFR
ncbi:MAG: acyl-CoA dehydrogenase family protein [Actinobacteria bacterium]|nr:acyl-CoA dehydrogenase family protein [Actinomycetota bacterium]